MQKNTNLLQILMEIWFKNAGKAAFLKNLMFSFSLVIGFIHSV
jgi:hypothetical protein